MITRGATLISRMAVALVILFAIAACGGGGGGSGGDFLPDTNDGSTLFVSIVMLGPDGNPTNTVTSSAPAKLRVTITRKNKNGDPVADIVVNATATIGVLLPASGSALTDSNGVAGFEIEAGNEKGAGTITATVDNEDGTFEGSFSFQIGSTGLRLGYFDDLGNFMENEIGIQPQATLSSAGRAQLSLAIVNEEGQRVSSAENVRLSSGCLSTGQATLDPASPLLSGDGLVSATYTANGCSGTDEITASLVGASAQAFGSVTIAPPEATGLTFVSADPTTIVLRGTGGGSERQDSSQVVFKVVDSNGSPVQGINVTFSLTTEVGGLTVSPDSALSGSDGLVSSTVFSGDIATVVRVIAIAEDSDGSGQQVGTVSDILTVSTGLPDQNSFDLSVSGGGFVVEDGFTMSGITRELTIRMGDNFNNPVPDGTAAVFTTEYGVIQPSCETTGGLCSVVWTSQDPRSPEPALRDNVKTINDPGYSCPSHSGSSGPCPDDLGYTRGGRSTILVTAIGQENFEDRNGNGIMDREERYFFTNLPEAFRDDNEDGAYTPALDLCEGEVPTPVTPQCIAGFGEDFIDFNSNLAYDLNNNPELYDGLLCPPEGDVNTVGPAGWCRRGLINVRASAILILSADPAWQIALYNGRTRVSGTRYNSGPYTVYISDIFNSRPPADSTITVEAGGDCEVTSEGSITIANTSLAGAASFILTTGGVGTQGSVNVTLTPKGAGAPFTQTFSCTPEPPPPPTDPNDPGGELGGGVG